MTVVDGGALYIDFPNIYAQVIERGRYYDCLVQRVS